MNRLTAGSVRVARSGGLLNDTFASATQSSSSTISNTNIPYTNSTDNQLNPLSKTAINKSLSTTTSTTVAKSDSVGDLLTSSKNVERAFEIIKQTDIICFDVDSTVIREEGIDELAEFCGKGTEVARVTKEAMGGAMTFQDALTIRLNIIKPSQKQIKDFLMHCPCTLTKNIRQFVNKLKADGKAIYLISGGFHCLIEPIADELGIPRNNIFANKLMFYFNGEYANFDKAQTTSRSGGKAEAVSIIKRQNPNAVITMIGDGATDLEASPPADNVIGFGGNVLRSEVHQRSKYYIMDFAQLM